ncbi:hypothetical protein BV25DRAFT_1841439 [Artomyces pyxidatus]|uniref:Uncharacterized protein n=1 Tax=Artomyces pyxidatus TaxID=48021 RepID=A0ACB8SNM3_9AGAM|nr:hypothetical protein BV25DRAFT_1841439 [Artomyces pyxidatus]
MSSPLTIPPSTPPPNSMSVTIKSLQDLQATRRKFLRVPKKDRTKNVPPEFKGLSGDVLDEELTALQRKVSIPPTQPISGLDSEDSTDKADSNHNVDGGPNQSMIEHQQSGIAAPGMHIEETTISDNLKESVVNGVPPTTLWAMLNSVHTNSVPKLLGAAKKVYIAILASAALLPCSLRDIGWPLSYTSVLEVEMLGVADARALVKWVNAAMGSESDEDSDGGISKHSKKKKTPPKFYDYTESKWVELTLEMEKKARDDPAALPGVIQNGTVVAKQVFEKQLWMMKATQNHRVPIIQNNEELAKSKKYKLGFTPLNLRYAEMAVYEASGLTPETMFTTREGRLKETVKIFLLELTDTVHKDKAMLYGHLCMQLLELLEVPSNSFA